MSAAIFAWLVAGCSCGKAPELPSAVDQATVAPITVPAGAVVDGVYTDDRYGFSIPVPERWTAEPGLSDSALRVALSGPQVRVEVWVFPGGRLEPRRREGCDWTFSDTGPYRALRVVEAVMAATCTPDDPEAPRIFAYLSARQDAVYQVEVHTEPGALAAAKEAGDQAVTGLRW